MILRTALIVAACPIMVTSAWAEFDAPAYDADELIQERNRVGPGIIETFREVILPVLGPAEAERLADVTWNFPLTVDGAEPYAFQAREATIEMSTASILFLKDISIASAWLVENGYTVKSLSYYLVMLKNGLLGDNPKKPLDALCIPVNARDDPDIVAAADTQAGMSLLFISLHELGHILYKHPGYVGVAPAQARANEAEADRFAIDVHERLGVTAASMFPTFSAMAFMAANPGDFDSQADFEAYLSERTHPLTSDRIEGVISIMRETIIEEFAGAGFPEQDASAVMDGYAEMLRPNEFMNMVEVAGTTALIYGLAPQRNGEWLGTPCGYEHHGLDFSGPYDGILTSKGVAVPTSLFLHRNRNVVGGALSVGLFTYSIHGEVVGEALSYRGHRGSADSRILQGRLILGPDGTLSGSWAYVDAAGDGGTVELHRRDPP